jgi:regulatory protein YycH of two-component signal transduction system YycFG
MIKKNFLTHIIMDILRIQTMRFSVSNSLKVCTEERSKLPKCIAEIGALTFQFTKVLDFSIFFGGAVKTAVYI